MVTVCEITSNADAFRAAYPNWPHPEPLRPACPALVPCKPCQTWHIPLAAACEPVKPCPACHRARCTPVCVNRYEGLDGPQDSTEGERA